ncbi:MAG: tRNA (adenosine(37)-N6)-threonylcarbamoyltransferase complex ATPase subunit type 1 TsaE [Gammaproteobacteria bacterium]|jgi:tRNA threonylcarbamoyladenosine biosynthesis protein TsaE|tara:strand:- start:1004 stop:1447 length:444 start_codon:yes stop_codon:yes gene_type:complete
MKNKLTLSSLEDTKKLGQELAKEILKRKGEAAFVVFLDGDLGTGKTTLVKEIIFALGVKEKVKSPTFTIIEPYELNNENIYHVDLYRIIDPSELEIIGLREYLNESNAIIFIEWPEKSYGYLKKFDLKISLKHLSENERKCRIELNT